MPKSKFNKRLEALERLYQKYIDEFDSRYYDLNKLINIRSEIKTLRSKLGYGDYLPSDLAEVYDFIKEELNELS